MQENDTQSGSGLIRSAVGLFKSLNPFSATAGAGDATRLRLLEAGSRLNDYVIDATAGHDGLIATYQGHSAKSGQEVMIKEFLPASLSTREVDLSVVPDTDENGPDFFRGLERFLDEGEMLRHVDHPNLAHVIEVFEFHRTAYIVFERVDGERLEARRARQGALDDDTLLNLGIGILNGLEQLHDAGVVHGQVNEQSVVFASGDRTVVVFNDGAGLASVRKRLASGVISGKRPADVEVQPSADLFALSLLLDRISKSANDTMTGERPVHHPEVVSLIGRALSGDPSERPASAAEWREAFEALQARLADPAMSLAMLDSESTTIGTSFEEEPTVSVFSEDNGTIRFNVDADAVPVDNAKLTVSDLVIESAPLDDDPIVEEEIVIGEKLDDDPLESTQEALALMAEAVSPAPLDPPAASPAVNQTGGGEPAVSNQSSKTGVDTMGMQSEVAVTGGDMNSMNSGGLADNPAQLHQIASGLQQVLAERDQMEQSYRKRIEELEARLNERTALLERSAVQLKQYDTAMKQSRVAIAERDDRERALRQRMDELERKLSERTAAAALMGDHEQVERSLRQRISELESQVSSQSTQLEKSVDQLRQYEETLQQKDATSAGLSETEQGLRKRVEELERKLAEQVESAETMAAERNKLTSALGEQRRLLEETQRQVKEVQPLAGGQQLQNATQAQLVELRKVLASEFARNAALVEVARQEAQAAEAARQRLVEQTELVLADYRSRNKKIRTQEEARIREERRLLEIERDFLRQALDTANKAREQAESAMLKATEQANRLRQLTSVQIESIESEVGSDVRKVRNGLPWTPKGDGDDGIRALDHDA